MWLRDGPPRVISVGFATRSTAALSDDCSQSAAQDRHDIIPSVKIGDVAPAFSLPDLNGKLHDLEHYRGRIAVLNFWSSACPHSVRTDLLLTTWLGAWADRVALIAIASNANESTSDMRAIADQHRLPVVLLDQQHRVADMYDAQTTPHLFVVDAQGLLRYTGAVDDVVFGKRAPERSFAHDAVQALLEGAIPALSVTSPYGCAIVRHALE